MSYEQNETRAFENRSPVNENSKPPDSKYRGTMLLVRKDFLHSLAGTLLLQSDFISVLGKTVVLQIVIIFVVFSV